MVEFRIQENDRRWKDKTKIGKQPSDATPYDSRGYIDTERIEVAIDRQTDRQTGRQTNRQTNKNPLPIGVQAPPALAAMTIIAPNNFRSSWSGRI